MNAGKRLKRLRWTHITPAPWCGNFTDNFTGNFCFRYAYMSFLLLKKKDTSAENA